MVKRLLLENGCQCVNNVLIRYRSMLLKSNVGILLTVPTESHDGMGHRANEKLMLLRVQRRQQSHAALTKFARLL